MHTPPTGVHRPIPRVLRSASERAAFGPRELCYVRRSGAPRGPLSASEQPRPPLEEALPRARARRRTSTRLAAHPQRDAASGGGHDLATLARAADGARAGRRHARRRSARREPSLGRGELRAPDRRVREGRARRRHARVRLVAARRPARAFRRARRATFTGDAFNPRLTFDQFVIGDANRLAHAAALAVAEMPGPGLQPALHLRAARARQDAPPALDRELRDRARRRAERALHDRRGLHRPVRRRAAHARARGLQGGLPRRRRPARRRRPVPAEQGPHRAGVLPHLQRAPGRRRAARAHVGPPAARPRRARGPPARALRGRPRDRRQAARPRDAPHDPLQARPAGRARSTSTRRPST